VLKLYAWSRGESLEVSLVLDDLLGALGGVGARRFFPGGSPPAGVPAPDRLPVTASAWRDPLRRALGLAGASAGSSAWVVGGAHSASGRPLLVADLQLEPTAPPLLHLAHLRGGGIDAAGVALPGLPGFWSGHNRRVAWASTNARAVVVDLYTEMLHPEGEPRYHDGRSWRRLIEREEKLRVREGPDELLVVRSTHHGPLVHELLPGPRDPLALGWVGLGGHGADTLRALLALSRAETADELRRDLGSWGEPAVSVVYADAAGAAGLQVAGWIPERALATELVPVPGRARWYDWKGPVPFESLPHHALEDGEGWVVAADNPLGAPSSADPSEWLWRHGVRARRIDAALRGAVARGPADLSGVAALQRDVLEPRAPELVTWALRLADRGDPLGSEAREVVELLRSWPGDSGRESAGAAAYHVFTSLLTEDLLRQQLGEELMRRYLELAQADPAQVVYDLVREAVEADSEDSEAVAASVRRSLRETWFELSYRLGASRGKWRWGRLHRLRFRSFVPAAPAGEAGLGPFEEPGSGSTVHTAEYSVMDPYDVRLASLCRFAVDAGALDHSLWSLAPGQSEHPAHVNQRDAVAPWREGRLSVLATSPALLGDGPLQRLVLEPAP
jgi:penicillin amidase